MNVDFLYLTPKSQIGALVLDVLMTEKLELPATVSRYPIEDGSEMSDHITQEAEKVTISGLIPATDALEFGGGGQFKILDALDVLKTIHSDRLPMTIITGMTRYHDMAMVSCTASRTSDDKGGNWLSIQAELQQIRKVSLRTTEISEERAAPSATGRAGQTQQPAGRTGSAEQLGPPAPPSSTLFRLRTQGNDPTTPLGGVVSTVRSGLGL